MFGEAAVLADGRRVITPWNKPGCFVGDTFIPGPQMRLPDATTDTKGRVWISAKEQTGPAVRVCCVPNGVWWTMPSGAFGTRTIIAAFVDRVRVAYTTGSLRWVCVEVTDTGATTVISQGAIPSGEGAHGMRDWDAAGNPCPLAPLDQKLNGHLVRSVVTHDQVSIACALDLPDQVVMSKGAALGTLALGGVDWPTPRISSNGMFWVGTDYAHAQVRGGAMPLVVPPLVTVLPPQPIPPEPPSVPAKATITSYQTPIALGETSRAVAQLTHGDPKKAWYQWQYLDGSWKNANTKRNPAIDSDHHYSLPHVGSFLIRLQTWDAPTGGTMTDQSSSTSRTIVVQSSVPPEPPTPIPPTPLPPQGLIPFAKADGRIFRAPDGNALRYKGVTAFKLCRLFTDGGGAAIDGFLAAYNGFNVLRVWDYVTWKDTGWESCTPAQWKAFLAYVALKGFNVELTLLTDDNSARIEPAKNLVRELAQAPRPTNLLIEIGNEPETHKHIDTKALQGTCETSGFLYASGNYESCGDKDHPCSKAFGKYGCAHTPRDSEWPRKAHDLMEYYNGKGPHYLTEPARPYPWVADEPAKMQDVQPPAATAHWTWADDWRAYFGTASLLGAGATFHSESGKYGLPPTAAERPLIAAALEGLNAFPADAPNGPYSRPSDKALRTYIVGNNMVRVRPETGTPSQSGWTRIGPSDVLWRR